MRERLRSGLIEAMKRRDTAAVAALRSAIAALDNAEAVDPSARVAEPPSSPYVAGASAGAGSADVERRTLTDADIAAVLREQVQERHAAAAAYERLGRDDVAERLRHEAEILRPYLP